MISDDDIWCDRSLVTAPVWYGLCTDEKTFKRQMKKMEVPKDARPPFISNTWSDATAHCFTKPDGKVVFLVCIRATPAATGIEIAGLLVHEAVHIWQEIKRTLGEREPSAEFEAYSIQKISQELMFAYHKQTVALTTQVQ